VAGRASARVCIVGVGGLGCPAALALAHAGVGSLVLVDDDTVERGNLHRQILFRDLDVGRTKLEAAADALHRVRPTLEVDLRPGRLVPGATSVIEDCDVVLECSDNFATKFLAADAAHLAKKPVVHGAAIRWIGTAMVVGARGRPCYRCLFEDVPEGAQASCDTAGVVGPVCGVVGALQAHLALKVIDGRAEPFGTLATFDGLRDTLRMRSVAGRPSCPLCGEAPSIDAIDPTRYVPAPSCI
jgi:molybdopterin/thiamine biosynthesis adenylyltransferase